MAALLISACQAKPPALTEQEAQNMQTLTKKMTPRCMGRYLIDVPEDMELNSEGGQEIEGVTIDIKPMTESAFKMMLKGRKLELESTVMLGTEKYPLLRTAIPLPVGTQGFVFDRANDDASGGRLNRMLELLAWNDGYRILATIKAVDTTFPEDAKDPVNQSLKNTMTENLAQLLKVFNRTKGRADHDIPTAQGVCILNGFISGPPTDQESLTIFYHLKTADDVYFTFRTVSLYAGSDSLLDRDKNMAPLIAENGGHTLRKGHRDVHDMKGQEYLAAIIADPNTDGVRVMTNTFIFEGNSRIGSAKTPLVTINLDNGTRKPERERRYNEEFAPLVNKATLSDAEAVALWDAVIPTLRPRPGAF